MIVSTCSMVNALFQTCDIYLCSTSCFGKRCWTRTAGSTGRKLSCKGGRGREIQRLLFTIVTGFPVFQSMYKTYTNGVCMEKILVAIGPPRKSTVVAAIVETTGCASIFRLACTISIRGKMVLLYLRFAVYSIKFCITTQCFCLPVSRSSCRKRMSESCVPQ